MLDASFPTNLPEFQAAFGTEEACLDYLRRKKWPEGFRCPRCGHDRSHTIRTRRLEQCASCRHQTSLTAGTIFHKTRKGLTLWFRIIFEFVSRKHGCNAMDIQRLFGFNRQTAWTWLHKIRECMDPSGHRQLSGEVEADETYVGGSEEGVYGRDRGSKKMIIAGAVEVVEDARCGRTRLAPVEAASQEHLQVFLANTIAADSAVHTDGFASYKGLEHAFEHNVEVIGDPKTASEKFPYIHRVFSLFKRLILCTYMGSVSKKYGSAYCNEFCFRFNRRTSGSRTLLVQRVLEAAIGRMPQIHLVAGVHGATSPVLGG